LVFGEDDPALIGLGETPKSLADGKGEQVYELSFSFSVLVLTRHSQQEVAQASWQNWI